MIYTISPLFWAITPIWDLIETWGFCVDIKDVKGIGLIMMRRRTMR